MSPHADSSFPPEPLSWLQLELYQLGELPPEELKDIEARLAQDEQARACYRRITEDQRSLPPLPSLAPVAQSAKPRSAGALSARPERTKPTRYKELPYRWLLSAPLATAATVMLVIWLAGLQSVGGPDRRASLQTKGGALTLELVRERKGAISEAPRSFQADDRFKPLVTCPAGGTGYVDLVVYQGAQSFFPLQPQPIRCGNRVPLKAFRLSGAAPTRVCTIYSKDEPPDREVLKGAAPDTDDGRAACVELQPAQSSP